MASTQYDFSGTWFDVELTMVVIQDSIMCGFEGQPIDLVTEGPSCAFKSGDETYRGKLQNPDHILWDDGEEWVRKGAPSAPEVTDKEVATEEKLRQKIQVFLQKRSAEQRAQEVKEAKEKERLKGGADFQGMASPERHSQNPSMQGIEEARARSQAGLDRARQAFEADRAREAALLERARAARAQQSQADAPEAPPRDSASPPRRGPGQEAPERPPAPGRPSVPERLAAAAREPATIRESFASRAEPRETAASPPPAAAAAGGMERARQMFEKEKARKAAALERARAQGSSSSSAAQEQAESALPPREFEQAKARSEAGIDRARKAFEEEKARKAAALERARAKASARVSDPQPPAPASTRQDTVSGASGRHPGAARQAASVGFPSPGARRQQEPRQEEFSQGQFVKIKDLASQPELNGQIATLVKFIEDKNRWQARIPGRPSILIKAENMEQATADEKASARKSPGPPQSRAPKGKGGGKDPLPQCVVQIGPGETGNKFDVRFAEEKSIHTALEKLVGALARRGVCSCEANAPVELIDAAYQEASDLWKSGEFGPPLAHMEGQPEEKVWQDVLFQSEEKVFWVREDLSGPRGMHGLKVLSQNLWDLAMLLAEELQIQMGISYDSYWSAMLSCYQGEKTYNLHLDNPNGADQSGIPDNGLRMSLCYFINPFWEPNGNAVTNCSGGLDIHLTEPWETPSSLLVARKAPVMRVAPHADTLVAFLSQRMAHRTIATQGNAKWFALWVYCYDAKAKSDFDQEAGELVKDVF